MRYELIALPVTDIHVKPPTGSMHRFDIEVEGSHNYLVDGVVVHNSPETTPGGRALKFYSSVRLDIRRIEAIKDGADVIGQPHPGEGRQEQVRGPVQAGRVRHHVRQGHQPRGVAARRRGRPRLRQEVRAWFTYEGEQLGQGRENVKTFLGENPQLMAEIDDRVRSHLAPVEDEAVADEAIVDPDDMPISLESTS